MTAPLQVRTWRHRSVLGIGEAMLEFAAVGGDTYRRGFAGDTLNTCWHMAQVLGPLAPVGYFTRVGRDAFSDGLAGFISASGIDASHISRDDERTLGLYVISLAGAERHFAYWRDTSAARRLADDPAALDAALQGRGLIHVSGITLAVIGEPGRRTLIDALARARRGGAVVSFDPNVRPRLWRSAAETRSAVQAMLEVVDIALPSFDDESQLWGDTDPAATLERLERAGIGEIVVKNGADDVAHSVGGTRGATATHRVEPIRDTTGAGDAFNAGYLAARLMGLEIGAATGFGQRLAGEVLGHFGALAPRPALEPLRVFMAERASAR